MSSSDLIWLIAGGAIAFLGCADAKEPSDGAGSAGAARAGMSGAAGLIASAGSGGSGGVSPRDASVLVDAAVVVDDGGTQGGRGGGPGPGNCRRCEVMLATTQSNAFHTTGDARLLATAELEGHTVFGFGFAGKGRLAFSGDGNVIYREGACQIMNWLGASSERAPRVLCIGAAWPCAGKTNQGLNINALDAYPGQLDYGGLVLPQPYAGQAAALRAAYDVVLYFGVTDLATMTWSANPDDATTLEQFVRTEGGGLYLVSEYWGQAAGPAQIDSLNALARPWSVEFEMLSLSWGDASASASLDCLPEVGPD